VPTTVCVADALRVLKANSSRWVHETWSERRSFAWQTGYAAFSVSQSNLDQVCAYVASQAEHHQRMTFQDELVAFLKRHGIEYDERYIWE
jgi:putative transposase